MACARFCSGSTRPLTSRCRHMAPDMRSICALACDAAAAAAGGGGADDDDEEEDNGKWTAPRGDGRDHEAATAAVAARCAEYCISHSTHCAVARTAVGTVPREIHADTWVMGTRERRKEGTKSEY